MPDIISELGKYEITAASRSIYQDLRNLETLGIEVEGKPERKGYHYRVVSRYEGILRG